ncbi:MAG TPA: glycosyltransferase family 4 protein [Caulobacteraceae bacterium]|jgi:glycosyltransferase involved in cell wall biosynthesis
MKPILLSWQAANTFGWGVAGLNIFYQWAMSEDVQPLMGHPIRDLALSEPDAARVDRFCAAVVKSNLFAAQLAKAAAAGPVQVDVPVVRSLGNGFTSRFDVRGSRNIGRAVFEDADVDPALPRLDEYDAIVCASSWNADRLRGRVRALVLMIPEGVDPALFHPAPKLGLLSQDRFYIFSGGKIEYRKAQDLVLMAFREFCRRHDDAVLVTAWRSPWPKLADGFKGRLEASARLGKDGQIDIAGWVADNGVDPAKVIDLGHLPNQVLPKFLREVDCALLPSRAEGGANLMAMEAMACGVPTILARNTGVTDIITADNCIALDRQSPMEAGPRGSGGWCESDVEEMLEALEQLYVSADLRRSVGHAGAAFMRGRTWERHAAALKAVALGEA